MRPVFLIAGLLAVSGFVACTPAGDDATGDDANVTGASKDIESPVVYLFDGAADKAALPKCAGALLDDKLAVTAKACAKTGMTVGRAGDKNGKGKQATITKVESPDVPDADIALITLDQSIGGTPALITHAPLRDGYSVQGIASVNERGLLHPFSPNKGDAASVDARMISETEVHSSIVAAKGSQICAGDMGAPVCSSTNKEFLGIDIRGTCGLAGIIVGAPEGLPAPDAPDAKNASDCSADPWKVTQLGRYAGFLKARAPKAFQPLETKKLLIIKDKYVPDGLWGYMTGGDVKTCKIDQAELAETTPGTEAKITATVSFANMQEKATAFARIGLAPKSAPTAVRWLPAASTKTGKGAAFDASYAGTVSADKDGEYVVLFRASGNGGESWTVCGDKDKPLVLKVATPRDTPEPPGTETPDTGTGDPGTGTTKPGSKADEAPASPKSTQESKLSDPPDPIASSSSKSGGDDGSDSSSTSEGDSEETSDAPAKKKKAADDSGCAAAPGRTSSPTLSGFGLLLGLGLLVRRRRQSS